MSGVCRSSSANPAPALVRMFRGLVGWHHFLRQDLSGQKIENSKPCIPSFPLSTPPQARPYPENTTPDLASEEESTFSLCKIESPWVL